MTTNFQTYPFIFARRDDADYVLYPLKGQLPQDLYGAVYITSPVGTVNSGGLPYPETYADGTANKEYASPLMNGDGMILKIDFNTPGQARLQAKVLKPPCYHADEATGRMGTLAKCKQYKHYAFRNMGIARLSPILGARNMLNTTVVPFTRKGETTPRLMATYDVGRPFEFDPKTLELITPIGANADWVNATPAMLRFPFPLIQTTAHPVFDPATSELFLVNYTKSMENIFAALELRYINDVKQEGIEKKLAEIAHCYDNKHERRKAAQKLLKQAHRTQRAAKLIAKVLKTLSCIKLGTWSAKLADQVFLMRWDTQGQTLQKWRVIDEEGSDLKIQQCMHQLGITQDYVLLADSSFKFTLDTLVNNPFSPNPDIDRFIRELLGALMIPYLDLYLVRRAELNPANDTVKARKLKQPIPLEAIHFSCNYANPNGQITLYTSHNAAACAAEWLRTYDVRATDGQAIDKQLHGLLAIGAMDLGRIGKFIIDAEKAEIQQQILLQAPLNSEQQPIGEKGEHTWAMSMYAYRGMLDAAENVNKIHQLYFISAGLDEQVLSKYIYDLYEEYPNRLLSAQRVLDYTKKGIPCCLLRVDTGNMKIQDHYNFPKSYNLYSLQFVPRYRTTFNISDEDLAQDGYLLCTLRQKFEDNRNDYRSEIWIFDAANLAQGPVTVLGHPKLHYGFTLHSAWIATTESPQNNPHKINIRTDYDELLRSIWWLPKRRRIQQLFEEHIYPHFEANT
jgi:carotenoid cleavage dioxygenase-like enzyme